MKTRTLYGYIDASGAPVPEPVRPFEERALALLTPVYDPEEWERIMQKATNPHFAPAADVDTVAAQVADDERKRTSPKRPKAKEIEAAVLQQPPPVRPNYEELVEPS